ncbi:MAG: hypothetical protein ACO3JL_12850, partial [Myxococcota bacterium]
PPPAPSFAPPPAPSFAPPALPPAKPHPHGPSSLTIGLLSFGLMAMLAGGVFGQLREAREQAPSLLVYQTKGKLDAIVALAEDAREPQNQLYSLGWPEPRLMLIAGGPREAVQPQALQRELKRAGIWQRALVPRTLRQRISALMPLAVFLLGALALSLSLPALRLRGASRAIGSAVMLLVTSGGAALLLQGGGLGWPGFAGQKVQEVVQPLEFQMVTNVPSMQGMPPDRSAPLARAILEARLALLRGKPQEALGVLGPVATPTLGVPEVFALLGDANVDLGRDGLAEGHYLRYLELASSARDRGILEAWLKQSH